MTCLPSDDPGRPRPHIRWVFGAWTRYPLAVPLLLEPGYWAGIPARPEGAVTAAGQSLIEPGLLERASRR